MSSSVPRGRRAVRAGSVVVMLLLGAGCGSGDQTLDAAAKTSLRDAVAEIRGAAGNLAKAKAAVAKFRADVDRLVKAGDLDAGDATVLLAQATQLEVRLTADSPPTPVAPAPRRTTSPEKPAADEDDKGKDDDEDDKDDDDKPGKNKGNGKGKGDRADR